MNEHMLTIGVATCTEVTKRIQAAFHAHEAGTPRYTFADKATFRL